MCLSLMEVRLLKLVYVLYNIWEQMGSFANLQSLGLGLQKGEIA